MDAALWESPAAERLLTAMSIESPRCRSTTPAAPCPHCSMTPAGRVLVVKGAPEQVLANCEGVPDAAQDTLAALFAEGRRVVAVASKPAPELTAITADDESGLALDGFLVFADEPKAAASDSLAQLAALGIEVKVATGDNAQVAEKVCADLGLPSKGTITGTADGHP